ncbi:MAG: nucleoside-diphosphate kinase [Candidatus Peribacteraceae bacterium]|jgi:nucleoside-diphosphate kinase
MERTLVLLKPDCVSQAICGKVISRFEESGYKILGCKMIKLSAERLREHYAHIADKPFYPEVEAFMQQTPVIAMVLEGEGIVETMREMLGVTDCLEAVPGTIREQYGSKNPQDSKMRNVVHASDSAQAAEKEVWRFFSEDELFEYQRV